MANSARARKELRTRTHGWFITPGRGGDRTLAQQLTGLSPMLAEVSSKDVLDVGCAEGLIAMECAKAGAKSVLGLELVPWHLDVARTLQGDLPCDFVQADANEYEPDRNYDVVLMLAVLHKLREPSEVCARFARRCSDLCVIRLGPDGEQLIIDHRSDKRPQYIGDVMKEHGFAVERSERGPLDEMTWYYRRAA